MRVELSAEFNRALEAQGREHSARIAEFETRMETATGKLPIAWAWQPEMVVYAGSFVMHDGSCWQAVRDTAKRPGDGDDWACIAKGGRNGVDGRSMTFRGEYDAKDSYARLDVVTRAGSCWVATRDNPGVLGESDGWTLIAAHGEQGERGKPGPRGAKGEKGDTIRLHSWQIDRARYRVSGLLEDATVLPSLELRGLFEQYQLETSD
jgi:hypothetical protein